MAGFLSSLEGIGAGLGQGAQAIQQQQQAAAQIAMQRIALQQAQARQQGMAAMLPGLVAAYSGQGQQQQPPGPPTGFTGPGFTTPGPTAPQTPMMAPASPSAPTGSSPAAVPVPPSLAPIYARESGGNYQAKNPTTSASGAGQDIELDLARSDAGTRLRQRISARE